MVSENYSASGVDPDDTDISRTLVFMHLTHEDITAPIHNGSFKLYGTVQSMGTKNGMHCSF